MRAVVRAEGTRLSRPPILMDITMCRIDEQDFPIEPRPARGTSQFTRWGSPQAGGDGGCGGTDALGSRPGIQRWEPCGRRAIISLAGWVGYSSAWLARRLPPDCWVE